MTLLYVNNVNFSEFQSTIEQGPILSDNPRTFASQLKVYEEGVSTKSP